MSKVISICAKKGGTGKTTTAIQLASGLLALGKRILLIDMDSQCNLTSAVRAYNSDLVSVYDILWQKCTVAEAVQSIVPNFDVIQSELKLDDINFEFATKPELLTNLKSALDSVKSSYDSGNSILYE